MREGQEKLPLLRERAFRGMFLCSAVLHAAALALVVWAQPARPRRIFYGASYAVQLVSAAEVGKQGGRSALVLKRPARKPPRKARVVRKRLARKPPRKARRVARARRVPVHPRRPKPKAKKPPEPGPEERVAAAIERIRRKVTQEEAAARARKAPAPAAGRAEEGPAEGTGLRGGLRREVLSLVGRAYFDRIIESVHNSWNLPGNLPGRERMVAVVTFRVLRDGSIRDIRVERSSGNVHFDNSALRAVEKIDPLPPFPAELGRDVLDIGVRFHNPEA